MLRALLAGLCLALPWPAVAAEPLAVPALQGRLTDLTGTLDAGQRDALDRQLAALENAGRAQAAVLLLPTTQPETIEQYGIRVAEAWKLGRKGVDDGLIILVAKNDRRMRIEVGYGLEGKLPDALAGRIISEHMAPAFRRGDFYGGLRAAVSAIDQILGGSGAVADAPPRSAAEENSVTSGLLLTDLKFSLEALSLKGIVFGALFTLYGLIFSLFAGALGAVIVAAIAAVWTYFVSGAIWFASLVAPVIFFLWRKLVPSASGPSGSAGHWSHGSYSSSADSFGSDSFGPSSSDSGGFSGGGGSFGGGGSSGSW